MHSAETKALLQNVALSQSAEELTQTKLKVQRWLSEESANKLANLWSRRNLNSQLLTSIEHCSLKDVIRCLEEGAAPAAICRLSEASSIHIAALEGQEEILNLLLQGKVSPYLTDKHGCTPMHYACWGGHTKCVKLLLECHKNYQTNPPETFSVMQNYIDCQTSFMYRASNDIERKDSMEHNCKNLNDNLPIFEGGSTALHVACCYLHPEIVQLILSVTAKLHIPDDRGLHPVDVFGELLTEFQEEEVAERFYSVMQLLLQHGATFKNDTRGIHRSPLHTAVQLNSIKSIQKLLQSGCSFELFDESGNTPIHLTINSQLEDPLKELLSIPKSAEIKNQRGFTPLQVAVETQWSVAIGLLLNAGADVTEAAADGSTVLHKAAITGNVDLLEEILALPDIIKILNKQNASGETPLFSSVISGVTECTELLLRNGADIDIRLPGNITVLHRAAEYGYSQILQILLEEDHDRKLKLKDARDSLSMSGMTPLHMAAYNNKARCVRNLLYMNCDFTRRTTLEPHSSAMAIHLAARMGNDEVLQELTQFDKSTLHILDGKGWNPLQIAAYHSQREAMKVLLQSGSDLAYPKLEEHGSPIEMLTKNVTRPTDFLEEVFDSCIEINDFDVTNPDCEIVVDYSILTPRGHGVEQMHVLKEFLATGNRYNQRKLLVHPVVESFLYMKWKTLSPFFYAILVSYTVFVFSLTMLAVSVYYYKETGYIFNIGFWTWLLWLSTLTTGVQESFHGITNFKKYVKELETWVKWSSLFLALLVAGMDHNTLSPNDWARHVTALAVLLAWTELMFLISRFPNWGYYVQMFFKVTNNVVKVLLTFGFLVIGFALSFLLEFQSEEPFSSPAKALVKTIVMMTSEFDYGALFQGKSDDEFQLLFYVGNIMFLAFLVLAAIVLMNLMVGLAVSDIQDLEVQGKIDRLVKQIDFLATLDNDSMNKFVPSGLRKIIKPAKSIETTLLIYPGRPRRSQKRRLPMVLTEEVIDLAVKKLDRNKNETQIGITELSEKVDAIMTKLDHLLNLLDRHN